MLLELHLRRRCRRDGWNLAVRATVDVDDVRLPGPDAESGRGLALAHAVLDGLRHESGPEGNTWTLWRTLNTH